MSAAGKYAGFRVGHRVGQTLGRSDGQAGQSPSQLGWSYWWKPVEGTSSLSLSGTDVVAITDEIAALDLVGDATVYPQWDGSKITFNGATQYLYSTNATLLGLVNGDDEAVTMAWLGSWTGAQVGGRAAGWSTSAASRHCGPGNDTAGTGYRLQRGSTLTDQATAHDTAEGVWTCVLNGATNVLAFNGTTIISTDLSAAGAQTYTHFFLMARITSASVIQQFLAGSIKQFAIKAGAASAQELLDLRTYWGH